MKAASTATTSRTKEKRDISNVGKKRVYNRKKQQQQPQPNDQAPTTTRKAKGYSKVKQAEQFTVLKQQTEQQQQANEEVTVTHDDKTTHQSMPHHEIGLFESTVIRNTPELEKNDVSSASSSPTSSIASSQQHSADYEAEDESDDNVKAKPEKSQNLMQVQKFLNCIAKEQRNVKKNRALSSGTQELPATVGSTEISAIAPEPIRNFESITSHSSVAAISNPLADNLLSATTITTAIAPIANANAASSAKSTVSELRTWRQNKKKTPPPLTSAANIAQTKPSTATTPTKLRKFNISPKFLHKSRNKLKSFNLQSNKSPPSSSAAATTTTKLSASPIESENSVIDVDEAAKSKSSFSIDSLLKKQQ